jgi:hypothetical protein
MLSTQLPSPSALAALPGLCQTAPQVCPVCGEIHPEYLGAKDFGVSCNDFFSHTRTYPDYDAPVSYFRCTACRFVFTPGFDNWTTAQIQEHIYNDDYLLSDPPFASERPQANAAMLSQMFLRDREHLRFLDYGAGMGLTAQALRKKGFQADAYDPFFTNTTLPSRKYDVVLAFEVLEHVRAADLHAWLLSLTELLNETSHAQIILSTDVDALNELERWYISPRNGHVSIHSPTSLRRMTNAAKLDCLSLSSSLHVLTRQAC